MQWVSPLREGLACLPSECMLRYTFCFASNVKLLAPCADLEAGLAEQVAGLHHGHSERVQDQRAAAQRTA